MRHDRAPSGSPCGPPCRSPDGHLINLGHERHIFTFDEGYSTASERPTLSLSFKSRSGGLITDLRPVRARVPPFFSNLLPEGHLRDYLARQAGVKPQREFLLLRALGLDLPGGVVVLPETEDAPAPAPDTPSTTVPDSPTFRFSLAGMQLKFSALLETKGGLTIPVGGGGGRWIVKLPSAQFPHVPENEFAMMELARRIGIEVPEITLTSVESIEGLPEEARAITGKALAVKRFDRTDDGGRIHMEDFAQVFGLFPECKYEKRSYANIAAVLAAEVGEDAIGEFVRRLTFSIAIGNADMHLKNWSVIYPDEKNPRLSPAYDLLSTIPYIPNQEIALTFGKSRSMTDITPETSAKRLAGRAMG
jgi:serine/threonine-protein kinase HipA